MQAMAGQYNTTVLRPCVNYIAYQQVNGAYVSTTASMHLVAAVGCPPQPREVCRYTDSQ